MPGTYYYTVTETREVNIRAESPVHAAEIAQHVFAGTEVPSSLNHLGTTGVSIKEMTIKRDPL